MQVINIYAEPLPWHPLLGRNIRLDSRSWDYALHGLTGVPVVSKRHQAFIDILDQGEVGSCTGNAGIACAYRSPFFAAGANPWRYAPNEFGALSWYSQNTREDPYAGTFAFPPAPGSGDDTGSDSTTVSKVAKEAGIISGYRMAPDLNTSLEQLMETPGITGIPFYNSMFNAPSSGLMHVDFRSGLAGGHELCVDEVVTADDTRNGTGKLLVGGPNSWGPQWGDDGRWYLTADDWWALRDQQGDCFFWVPNTQPAPQPTPPPDPEPQPDPSAPVSDADLWAVAEQFTKQRHVVPNYKALSAELKAWHVGRNF